MLKLLGDEALAGLNFVGVGDIARDGKKIGRPAVLAEDGRDMDIPVAVIARRGIGGAVEAVAAAGARLGDGAAGLGVARIGPEIRPRAAFEDAEVGDLHHPLAALAHELQAAVEIEDLDAIAAAREDCLEQRGIAHEDRIGRIKLPRHRRHCRHGVDSMCAVFTHAGAVTVQGLIVGRDVACDGEDVPAGLR